MVGSVLLLPDADSVPDDTAVLAASGKSGATGSPLKKLAIDWALAFLVPVYGYFSLKMILLIRVISVMIS